MRWIAVVLALSLLSGCTYKQIRQEFLGMTIDDVRTDKNKQTITVNMGGPECYDKIKEILKSMDAIVRENKKKHFIYADNFQRVFPPAINTTEVAIVVTWLEPNKCQIELASNNIDLAVFVSGELAKGLNPKPVSQGA